MPPAFPAGTTNALYYCQIQKNDGCVINVFWGFFAINQHASNQLVKTGMLWPAISMLQLLGCNNNSKIKHWTIAPLALCEFPSVKLSYTKIAMINEFVFVGIGSEAILVLYAAVGPAHIHIMYSI